MKKLFLTAATVIILTTAAFSQTTYSNIESMSGFGSCTTCAGADGSGSTASYWMKQHVSSPSLDGSSTQFFLGGSTPYSDAIWWKKLPLSTSTTSGLKHFVYDTYFYYKNASAVQGLEFNVTQYFYGKAFVYGIQCDVRSSGTWEVSTSKSSSSSLTGMYWKSTGIACPAPPTYKWNHVTFEFARTSSSVYFVSVTVNGVKHYINQYSYARVAPSSWGGVTTHFQMNGNYRQDDYSVWVDKWKAVVW